MSKNVEIKARIEDLDSFLSLAKRVAGNVEPTVIDQRDTFFAASQRRLKLREFLDGTPAELIAYDRPDQQGPKVSDFVKARISAVDDVPALKEALIAALGIIGTVAKRRYLVLAGRTRIHIDDVEGLGTFMELEVPVDDDQSMEQAEKVAQGLMVALGIGEKDLIQGAYLDLQVK